MNLLKQLLFFFKKNEEPEPTISDKQSSSGESSPNQQLINITDEASETENSRPCISTSLDERSSPQYTLVNEKFISIIVIYFIDFVNSQNLFLIS